MKGSKATSSMRPRLQPRVDAGERRLIELTARRCFVRCRRTSAASLGWVRWSKRRLPRKRTTVDFVANARSRYERVLHVNRLKGLLFSQRVSGYEPLRRDRGQRLEELATGDGRCRLVSRLRSAGHSIVSDCCSRRSKRWRPIGTRFLLRNKSRRRRQPRCCPPSRVSGRSSPPSSGRKLCDTGDLCARSRRRRVGGVSRLRVFGTAHQARLARRRGGHL